MTQNEAERPGRMPAASSSATEHVDVSVLIPVRNGLPYFTEQLSALGRQTYTGRWEVIVSDNGSADGSGQAARAAADRIPLRVVDSSEALGRGGALAVAAGAARGRLLLICDADDVVADDWVEHMAAALERYPAVGGHLDDTSLNPPEMVKWRPSSTPGYLPRPFGLLTMAFGGNLGVRREVWDEVGGFDPSFRGPAAEETDLSWRIQLAGHEIAYVPDAVVAYRYRPDLRSLLGQWRNYGRGRAHLVARYQSLGLLPKESWRDALATTGWLILHSVNCLRGAVRRACFLRVLAHVVGQVEGSFEVGVLHIRRRDSPAGGARDVPGLSVGGVTVGRGTEMT
jgi:GT2 family glycosyltransferase